MLATAAFICTALRIDHVELDAQVVGASDDGKEYGTDDAQLHLENGRPRSASGMIMLRYARMATMGPPRAPHVLSPV